MPGVEKFVVQQPVTVTRDMNVYDASHIILSHQISGVAVVDQQNKLIGMLSELDCLRAMVTSVYNGADPGGALVGDIMIDNVEVNHAEDDIIEVATAMLEKNHRRRPIVDDNGILTGQITCRQILKAVTELSVTDD
jgi:CBS domain-containing protein